MDERNSQNINENAEIKNQQLIKELENVRKRERLLKIIVMILISIVVVSASAIYLIYLKYKRFSQTIEKVAQKIERDLSENKTFEELTKNLQSINVSSISLEDTSLSKIGGFSKELVESASKPESIEKVEELVDEYYNDPAINEFIERFKNDPEMKEIFQAPPKDRAMMMFKKINDPNFMQKITKEFLSNPQLIQSFMKMSSDPRIQQLLKDSLKKDTVKSQSSSKKKTNQ